MTRRWATLASVLTALLACAQTEPPGRPPARRARDMDVDAIPAAPVHGTVHGEPFQLAEAWYRVVRFHGRERIDLILSEGHATRLCGESDPELARHVWLRFPGITRFAPGVARVDPPAQAPFSVHYEWTVDEKWRGHAGGSAVVALDTVEFDRVTGRVRVCFDDAAQSCVEGGFRASECRNELDVDGPRAGVRQREGTPVP
jgi:hypothetical protein